MRTFSIDELRREGQNLGREAFLARHTLPFLVVDQLGGSSDDESFVTLGGDARRAQPRPGPVAGAPGLRARAVVVKKRDGSNDFANMITIGRAGNNDVALEISSVSKFHAYLTKDADSDRWHLHDAGSSNGTWVDGERLGEGHTRAPLRDGATIQLGPDARARFFTPAALHDLILPKKV